ncbi:hypothetical protein ACHAQH_003627 [Verticillium albo-atrum]
MASTPTKSLNLPLQGFIMTQDVEIHELQSYNEASNNRNDTYTYGQLPRTGSLRVLILEPSRDPGFRISCKLQRQLIRGGSPFKALSYTWGTDKPIAPILVDDKIIHVRYNLFQALHSLCLPDKTRRLWVDAMCINQSDITERKEQVMQMTEIYSAAEEVIVWLGGPPHSVMDGMSAARIADMKAAMIVTIFAISYLVSEVEIVRQAYNQGMASLSSNYELYKRQNELFVRWLQRPSGTKALDNIRLLFVAEWWRRVWTLQEIALAQKVIVHFGKHRIDWETLEILSEITSCLETHAQSQDLQVPPEASKHLEDCRVAFLQADNIRTLRTRVQKRLGNGIPLSLMMETSAQRTATDPRDRVFGLLGVVDRKERMVPDYSLTVEEVYTAAMKQMLHYFGDLRPYDFLSDGGGPKRNQNLPSWVPDFATLDTRTNPSRLTFRTGATKTDELAMPHLYAAGSLRSGRLMRSFASFDGDKLTLKGVPVDVIDLLGNTLQPAGSILDLKKGTFGKVISEWRSLTGPHCGRQYVTGISANEAFWRTVTLDCKIIGYHPGLTLSNNPRDTDRRLRRHDALVPPNGSEDQLIAALEKQTTWGESFQIRRRFFATKQGYMGLGPSSAKAGDIICALFGGEVPYVLRPKGNGRFSMVGQWQVTTSRSTLDIWN